MSIRGGECRRHPFIYRSFLDCGQRDNRRCLVRSGEPGPCSIIRHGKPRDLRALPPGAQAPGNGQVAQNVTHMSKCSCPDYMLTPRALSGKILERLHKTTSVLQAGEFAGAPNRRCMGISKLAASSRTEAVSRAGSLGLL